MRNLAVLTAGWSGHRQGHAGGTIVSDPFSFYSLDECVIPNVGVLQPTEGSCADHSRAPCRSTSDPIRLLPRCVTHSGQALVPLVSARDFGMAQIDLLRADDRTPGQRAAGREEGYGNAWRPRRRHGRHGVRGLAVQAVSRDGAKAKAQPQGWAFCVSRHMYATGKHCSSSCGAHCSRAGVRKELGCSTKG